MTSARITDEDIKAMYALFRKEKSAGLSDVEVMYSLRGLGWTKITLEETRKLIANPTPGADANAGLISREQLIDIVRRRQRRLDGPEEVHLAFRLFDVDQKGRISTANLRHIGEAVTGRPVPEVLVKEIMRYIDTDRDGYLSFEEFRRAVAKNPLEPQLTAQDSLSASLNDAMNSTQVFASFSPLSRRSSSKPRFPAANVEEEGVTEKIAGVPVKFVGGLVTSDELKRALKQFGYDDSVLSEEDFRGLLREFDKDRDGNLTKSEYCQLIVSLGETVDGY